MVEKIKPRADIGFSQGNDGRDAHYYIKYSCPSCFKSIRQYDIACDECGTFFDWSQRATIETTQSIVWK